MTDQVTQSPEDWEDVTPETAQLHQLADQAEDSTPESRTHDQVSPAEYVDFDSED